jgi:hypothetical protein
MTFDCNQLANQKKTPLSIVDLLASLLLLSPVNCVPPLVNIEAGADETCPHPCPRDTGDTEHLLGLSASFLCPSFLRCGEDWCNILTHGPESLVTNFVKPFIMSYIAPHPTTATHTLIQNALAVKGSCKDDYKVT